MGSEERPQAVPQEPKTDPNEAPCPGAGVNEKIDRLGLHLHFGSRFDLVDRAILSLKAYLAGEAEDRIALFEVEVVAREALVNAVRHGNGEHPERMVRFDCRVTADRLTMFVADEGPGFDWRTKMDQGSVPPDQTCGRGLLIMKAYGFGMRHNEAGNELELTKPLASSPSEAAEETADRTLMGSKTSE
ncbi:ATP-binding protein [Sulfidibacter corallicola]|uniref:ATP-binding protein n=1 Tax=Sulfidibacter corallicola TaxID=2818388 RepID=A0A8A4TIY4_SULCO|nr:ATP-binding protein [Sulfidibacter corallicola]QTD48758.1 ATP-binding protein [Sulfidibacter corallicola]